MTVAVIPAYNEEGRVGKVVSSTKKFVNAVIVVDDGSTDGTAREAKKAGARVIRLVKNLGKGHALREGVMRAKKLGGEIVMLDADGQHRPKDIPKLLKRLESADIVFGQRIGGKMPLIKRFGNWSLQRLFNLLFGGAIKDTQCGFKAVKPGVIEKIMWNSNGYFVDTEIAARASYNRLKIAQVTIPVIYHDPKKGTGVWDGIKIGVNMIWLRLKLLFS